MLVRFSELKKCARFYLLNHDGQPVGSECVKVDDDEYIEDGGLPFRVGMNAREIFVWTQDSNCVTPTVTGGRYA